MAIVDVLVTVDVVVVEDDAASPRTSSSSSATARFPKPIRATANKPKATFRPNRMLYVDVWIELRVVEEEFRTTKVSREACGKNWW